MTGKAKPLSAKSSSSKNLCGRNPKTKKKSRPSDMTVSVANRPQ
jgi:hypothetical protein